MNIETTIREQVAQALQQLYNQNIAPERVQLKPIPKHLEGDYAVVTFPFAKQVGKKPNEIAAALATQLPQQSDVFSQAEAKGAGFCNVTIGDSYWTSFVQNVLTSSNYGQHPSNGQTVLVEYSSPNTNKPLHLGHIRNNLLGYAMSEILKAAGYTVKKVQIVNDRGVHICKSMLAWQRYGAGETPESSGMKGDHLVGKYYVAFEKHFQEEYKAWQPSEVAQNHFQQWQDSPNKLKKAEKVLAKQRQKAVQKAEKAGNSVPTEAELEQQFNLKNYFFKDVYKNQYFNEYSALGQATKTMLQQWEEGDAEVRQLWETMNGWVYDGFAQTYQRLGVDFDQLYYESQTYVLGRQMVLDELGKGEQSLFYKKEDGSTWIDLTDAKLDEKVVLRKDGTSMYITQDIGTATLRYQDFNMDKMVYVVGNEQDYHFKVLFETLGRLGYDYAKQCHHLSYGMVNLTTGKMKSREGTVVDADDLMNEVIESVKQESQSRQKLDGLSDKEKAEIYAQVGLGALKFYILKVEPKKSMIFDPQQSIDLQGQTGPYVQNAYVRTQSVQRMVQEKGIEITDYTDYALGEVEHDILVLVHDLPTIVQRAAEHYNPAEVVNYLYDLAKAFHQFWSHTTILDAADPAATSFRLDMSKAVATALRAAGKLVGMDMPERM